MAEVLLLFGAFLVGVIVTLCSTHPLGVAAEGISTLPKTSPVMLDCSEAVKEPLYDPLTQNEPVYF